MARSPSNFLYKLAMAFWVSALNSSCVCLLACPKGTGNPSRIKTRKKRAMSHLIQPVAHPMSFLSWLPHPIRFCLGGALLHQCHRTGGKIVVAGYDFQG